MSDFRTIINYLKYRRSQDEKEAKTTTRLAVVIDPEFKIGDFIHEEDYKYVSKQKLSNYENYFGLMHLLGYNPSSIYVERLNDGDLRYYLRRERNQNGQQITQLKQLPYGEWLQANDDGLTQIMVDDNVYFSVERNRFIYIPLDELKLYTEQFVYDPQRLTDSPTGNYSFKFKDVNGYEGGFDISMLDGGFGRGMWEISEKKRKVYFEKQTTPGLVHLLPKIDLGGNGHQIHYAYYEKGIPNNSSLRNSAISLGFNHFSGLLGYLNATVFYYFDALDDFETTKERENFFDDYSELVNGLLNSSNHNNLLEVLYYIPSFFYKKLDHDFIWKVLDKTLEGALNNIGLDTESVVLRLLEGLLKSSANADVFLLKLLEKRSNKPSRFMRLYEDMDGEEFVNLIQFMYRAWLQSSFIDLRNPLFASSTGPMAIPYKSEKFLGFYSSNRNFDFKNQEHIVVTEDEYSLDNVLDMFNPEKPVNLLLENQTEFIYHFLHPMMLTEVDQETLIPTPKIIPAFFLKANEDKAYWSNVLTSVEYAVDALSILSGVASISRFRYLARVATTASKGTKVEQALGQLNRIRLGFDGGIEIGAGSVNVLIKLADLENEPFWQELNTFLFWLEMLSLGGELTAGIQRGLANSSEVLLKENNANALEEALDDLVRKGEIENFDKIRVLNELGSRSDEVFDYSSHLAKKVSKLEDRTPKKILDFEESIKLNENEWGAVYNKRTGYYAHHTSNLRKRVNFPDGILKNLFNTIVTHNHPKGTGLSIGDLKFFLRYRLVELRIKCPDGSVFSIKNGNFDDINNIKSIDHDNDLELLEARIEHIENKYSDLKKSDYYKKVFEEVFDLVKDKVRYEHYIN